MEGGEKPHMPPDKPCVNNFNAFCELGHFTSSTHTNSKTFLLRAAFLHYHISLNSDKSFLQYSPLGTCLGCRKSKRKCERKFNIFP